MNNYLFDQKQNESFQLPSKYSNHMPQIFSPSELDHEHMSRWTLGFTYTVRNKKKQSIKRKKKLANGLLQSHEGLRQLFIKFTAWEESECSWMNCHPLNRAASEAVTNACSSTWMGEWAWHFWYQESISSPFQQRRPYDTSMTANPGSICKYTENPTLTRPVQTLWCTALQPFARGDTKIIRITLNRSRIWQ